MFLVQCAGAPTIEAQVIDTVMLSELGRYQHPYVIFPDSFSATTFSSRIDRLERPYLYMACGDSGLMVLDISAPSTPVVELRLRPSAFEGLFVSNVEQSGALLYLALGDFQGADEGTGMAIVDVSDPQLPVVLDTWNGSSTWINGCAIVRVNDGVAFLGAMEDGIIALDVSDPSDIQFIASYQPDPAWPGIASYPPNARGLAIVDDVLYLAYDAGGLRAIDISDPADMAQIGQYLNPDHPVLTNPAYNNILVIGDRAYCTIDYCGLEVVDISDPANMTQTAWLNPWNCIGLSWFGSDGHANEVISASGDSLLYVSGADSELMVYDITEGDAPELKGGIIQPNDTAATWGVDVFGDRVVGNFINTHGLPFQPYDSKYGGVVIYESLVEFVTGLPGAGEAPPPHLHAWPNPTKDIMEITTSLEHHGPAVLRIMDVHGRLVHEIALTGEAWTHQRARIDLSDQAPGPYYVTVTSAREHRSASVALLAH